MASDPFVPFEFADPVVPGWPGAAGAEPVRLAPPLEQARRLIARRVGLVHPGEERSLLAGIDLPPLVGADPEPLEAALLDTERAHLQALVDAGIPEAATRILRTWVDTVVQARLADLQIRLRGALAPAPAGRMATVVATVVDDDPMAGCSAVELGQALSVTDETVRNREQAGEVFSLLRPGRKRGREYPAFQAWPGIAGAPLAQVLKALGAARGEAYGFFAAPNDLLAGLTPVELLAGRALDGRAVEADAVALLQRPPAQRLELAVAAAEAHAATLAG